MELWKNLKPDTDLGERLTEKWIDIGFQAKDPATDFRGAGLLGLELLHRTTGGSSTTKTSKENVFKFTDQVKNIYADSVN